MRYYETDNNTTGKRAGMVAVVAYVAILLLVFLILRVESQRKLSDEGMLIDFGTTETGAGVQKTTLAQHTTPTPPSRPVVSDNIATQDVEDAPEVAQQKPEVRNPERRPAEQVVRQPQTTVQQPAEEKPREVNPRALFPGQSTESDAQSHGRGDTAGNQGNPAGGDGGVSDGTGTGSEGHSFNLQGRQLVGSFPQPAYPGRNKYGRVVIEIIVNSKGVVETAQYIPKNSTTQDDELVRAARAAALKAKFTPDDKNPVQAGTITYIFKLN